MIFQSFCVCLESKNFVITFLLLFSTNFSELKRGTWSKKYVQTIGQLMQFSYLLLYIYIYIYIYIFCAIIFLNKSEQREIPQRLLDKCSSLFICMQWAETCLNPDIGTNSSYCNALIWTSLSSLKVNQQKPVDMVLYKQYTLTRSTTLFSRNHPELSVTQYLTVTSSNSQKQPPEVFYKKTCS